MYGICLVPVLRIPFFGTPIRRGTWTVHERTRRPTFRAAGTSPVVMEEVGLSELAQRMLDGLAQDYPTAAY